MAVSVTIRHAKKLAVLSEKRKVAAPGVYTYGVGDYPH